jgi:hypothetical protein
VSGSGDASRKPSSSAFDEEELDGYTSWVSLTRPSDECPSEEYFRTLLSSGGGDNVRSFLNPFSLDSLLLCLKPFGRRDILSGIASDQMTVVVPREPSVPESEAEISFPSREFGWIEGDKSSLDGRLGLFASTRLPAVDGGSS